MRWFRGHAEAPRLLSLSPLHADEELEGASFQLHAESRLRDMSPVRWARRKSSSSESERNCYNVQTSQVTTERSSQKKDKRRIQEERRRSCEKRNPLLDRVKNTRLSFFKDRDVPTREDDEEDNDEDNDDEDDDDDDVAAPQDDTDRTQFRSMCELSGRGLTRSEFRRSVCEIDLKVTEDEKTRAKRKRRCKSQSRLPARRNLDERFGFLGLGSSTSEKSSRIPDSRPESPKPRRRRWLRGGKDSSDDPVTASRKSTVDVAASEDPEAPLDEVTDGSRYDSVTPSSCLAAKFRAMQDRYLKSSTSRLIAKIYRKDGKDREKRRLRSFSYGALPGLEELRTNPLFEDQDQDDNDSGILDNGSATSSLLDDRCSTGGATGFPTLTNETSSSPPRLPPRGASIVLADLERRPSLSPSDSSPEPIEHQPRGKSLREFPDTIMRNLSLGIERDPLKTVNRSSIDEPIRRKIGVGSESRLARSLGRREILDRTETRREADSTSETRRDSSTTIGENPETRSSATRLPVVRSASYTTETTIVRLPRATADQCLGIFIARTPQSSPGYVVAHVVPNGLADREGTLRIGDEILIVNGKRLRGLSMSEARRILGNGSGPGEVDIVVSRQVGAENPRRLKESSVDYENVCVENGHVNGNINNNTITINKNKDSANNNNNNDDKKNNNNNNNINATTEQLDSLSSPKSHFRKHNSRHHRDRKNESNRSISSEKSSALVGDSGPQSVSNFCTLPRRPRSSVSTFHTVVFEKGQGKKSLGFTIVGGRDSPKGSIGIFIKSVLPGGQAAEDGRLRAGDEILAVNGQVSHDLTHREAVQLFRNIKSGPLALHLCRRVKNRETQAPKAKSCADLLLVDT